MKKTLLMSLVLMFALFQQVMAQTRAISGRVTDQKTSDGLPGVTVLLKGTTTGVSTNSDGNFSLNVPANGGTLVISSVNFVTQELPIGSQSQFTVALVEDTKQLSEVVVTGYGTQERRDVTGSVVSVKGETIANLATPSFAQQLAGRAAGVQVQTPSGLLGQQPIIQIRGTNSITSGSTPLVVVDGQPIFTGQLSGVDANGSNGLADINPNDIESYEVLKDGSATAIYGSRGANGVILITTKHGRKGQATITYDTYIGAANVLKRYKVLGADDFIAISNEKDINAGGSGQLAKAFTDATGANNNVSTDWQKEVFRTGFQQNHAISVSGGTDKTSYAFSGGFTDQSGIIKPNSLQRFTFRANVDSEVKSWLKVGMNIGLTRTQTVGLNTAGNGLSGNVAAALLLFPNVPARNADGTPYSTAAGTLGQGSNTQGISFSYPNIDFALDNNIYRSTSYRILGNGYLEAEPVKNLRLRTQLSTDTQLENDLLYYDPRQGDGRGVNGLVYQYFSPNIRWNWINTATYSNIIGENHKINAVVGVEYQKTTSSYFSAQGTGISDRLLGVNGIISNTLTTPTIGGDYYQNGYQSYFGRVNYSFKDRYLLSFTLRSDALSSLAPGHQRGTFPGGSLGWRVSQEDFFKNSALGRVWTDFKLRASYAQVGNSDIGIFPYAGTYSPVQYGAQAGVGYSQFGNGLLKYETSKKEDYGIDMGFLGGRITVTADYYRNIIDGLILGVPTAPSLGVPNNSYSDNVGSMYNKGFELGISTQNVRNENFSWTTTLNFSTNRNQVTSLGANNTPIYNTYLGGTYTVVQVGQSISSLYGFDYQGVNSANGNPIYKKIDGTLVQGNITGSAAGVTPKTTGSTYYVYDPANPTALTTVSSLSTADKIILGQTNPKLFGGFDNGFTYKGFDLDVFLRYSFGNQIMNATRQQLLQMTFLNNSTEILDRWQKPGDVTSTPRAVYGTDAFVNTTNAASSRFVESGNFVRVQHITLGYTLPSRVLGPVRLSRVRIFAQVQNLATFTKYKGADPEVSSSANNTLRGIDYNSNPQQRVFTGGLNIGF
ncbi:SusC/RagA family TonB-linked outer membrane protein [Hymenobacter caeli]|uniref:TonB-linked SusC/RagA family outer membrane protein n=1 Tax=Hymenobacter caeli TaxID=2735894 RepID=A0ABX2FRG6_9BACT|nr:TonB-dependent receptor [Hymenobacter caeli]NRT19037.1 TonB-linked SusC/RagA family outer membrane protein [Hymenobacter caeli]